ncbi:hypothetical protein EIP91_007506 [Steccherinum ochraceum]|uniref:DUF6534 domain-containing protein n=1 Tax=Steccherinum ochraceum TaxID=92696 RepID=A0A4R0R6I9_9APHY|nr:hypothetical protein EIP91_007506 [Steccherinum ochraceum]
MTDLTSLLGPVLLAQLFNHGLFGILTVQVYLYYVAFPRDRFQYKATVAAIFITELAQVGVATYDTFLMFASGWGNPTKADAIRMLWMDGPLMIAIIGVYCQWFYARRIYALCRNYLIVTVIYVLCVLQFAFGVYAAVQVHNSQNLSECLRLVPTKSNIVNLLNDNSYRVPAPSDIPAEPSKTSTSVKVDLYYIAFPRDRYAYKITVAVVFGLELAQVGVATYDAFRMFASEWGNFPQADAIGLYWMDGALMIETVAAVCQCFYASRIYALGHNLYLVALISILCLLQLGCGIYVTIEVYKAPGLTSLSNVYTSGIMWSSTAIACNSLVTCSMFYYLWRAKRASPLKRTRTTNMLSRMILYTIETGFVAVAGSIMAVVSYVASPSTSLWFLWIMLIGKLYSNCLLAVLNARLRIEGGKELHTTPISDESIAIRTDFDVLPRTRVTGGRIGDPRCEGQDLKADKNVDLRPDASQMA